MSAEKKVLLLFLSLIMLIIVCVYTHLPNFMQEDNNLNVAKIEKSELSTEQNEIIVTDADAKIEGQEPTLDAQINEGQEPTLESEVNDTQEPNLEVQTNVSTNGDVTNITNTIEEEALTNSTKDEIENTTELVVTEENLDDKVPQIPLLTTDERYIRTANEKNIEELSKKTQELQIKISDYVKENQVSFKRGSFKIRRSSIKTINMILEILNEFENLKIEVAGHTDAVGAAKLNQSISLKRAEAVKNALVSSGINEDRIIPRGYGEYIPLVKNSPNGYSKINRRVEFNIVEE